MASRVLGVGLGVFLIAFLWFIALALSLIFYRIRTVLSLIFTCLAAILTAVILALPRADYNEDQNDYLFTTALSTSKFQMIIDSFFVGRMVVLGTLTASAMAALTLFFYLEVVQPRRQPVTGLPIRKIETSQNNRIENLR